jgi:hypothetical protein
MPPIRSPACRDGPPRASGKAGLVPPLDPGSGASRRSASPPFRRERPVLFAGPVAGVPGKSRRSGAHNSTTGSGIPRRRAASKPSRGRAAAGHRGCPLQGIGVGCPSRWGGPLRRRTVRNRVCQERDHGATAPAGLPPPLTGTERAGRPRAPPGPARTLVAEAPPEIPDEPVSPPGDSIQFVVVQFAPLLPDLTPGRRPVALDRAPILDRPPSRRILPSVHHG